jgi:hypothetical protein
MILAMMSAMIMGCEKSEGLIAKPAEQSSVLSSAEQGEALMDSSEDVKPVEPAEPLEPIIAVEPAELLEPAEPIEPAQCEKPAQLAEPNASAEPAPLPLLNETAHLAAPLFQVPMGRTQEHLFVLSDHERGTAFRKKSADHHEWLTELVLLKGTKKEAAEQLLGKPQ